MYANVSRIYWKQFLNTLSATVRRTIVSSPHESIQIPNITLPEFIFQSFDKHPNEIAVECSVTKKRYTFDDIRRKVGNFDTNLREKLKLNKGDVVAVILPNVPDFPICVLGVIQAGLIVTLINPSYTSEEITWQLNDTKVKAIITLGATYSTVKAATDVLKIYIPILIVKMEQAEGIPVGAFNLTEFTETKAQTGDVFGQSPNDIILLPYSSGTTGLPKGVELTHNNIISNICQLSCDAVVHLPTRTESHVNVTPAILPWFHIYGITVNLFKQLYNFSKIISVPKFTPEGFVKVLSEYSPNIIYSAPPLFLFLSGPLVKPKLLERAIVIASGAAPLSMSDEDKLIKKLNRHVDIIQGYGLTEASPTVTVSTKNSISKFGHVGSSGLVLPNSFIKILSTVNPTIELSKPNMQGEILIKGPQVMKRYYNRPKETEQTFLDGWLRTGDLGHFDDNGLLYVTDRIKELIKVKGFQVAPAELEGVLRTHKDVSDAGVIGVADGQSSELPLAYVVPKMNTKLNVEDLQGYMSKKVANYKQLKGGIIVVDSLPKSASGKLLRRELKLQYENNKKN